MKRLFLFAFFDPQGVVGEAVLRYLEALHALGDIVLAADCALQTGEEDKLVPLVVSYTASRHGEYDFGSYKRAYQQADLSGYNVVYLVNDSVVGPLQPLEPYLQRMEALGTDAFGLVLHPSRKERHLQSWFIGLKPSVFRASWFSEFLAGVEAVGRKEDVCIRYENGLARLLEAHSASAFTRHGGSLGAAVAKTLAKADPAMADAVVADMDRLYGEEYRRWFLSATPLRAFGRYLHYLFGKLTGR